MKRNHTDHDIRRHLKTHHFVWKYVCYFPPHTVCLYWASAGSTAVESQAVFIPQYKRAISKRMWQNSTHLLTFYETSTLRSMHSAEGKSELPCKVIFDHKASDGLTWACVKMSKTEKEMELHRSRVHGQVDHSNMYTGPAERVRYCEIDEYIEVHGCKPPQGIAAGYKNSCNPSKKHYPKEAVEEAIRKYLEESAASKGITPGRSLSSPTEEVAARLSYAAELCDDSSDESMDEDDSRCECYLDDGMAVGEDIHGPSIFNEQDASEKDDFDDDPDLDAPQPTFKLRPAYPAPYPRMNLPPMPQDYNYYSYPRPRTPSCSGFTTSKPPVSSPQKPSITASRGDNSSQRFDNREQHTREHITYDSHSSPSQYQPSMTARESAYAASQRQPYAYGTSCTGPCCTPSAYKSRSGYLNRTVSLNQGPAQSAATHSLQHQHSYQDHRDRASTSRYSVYDTYPESHLTQNGSAHLSPYEKYRARYPAEASMTVPSVHTSHSTYKLSAQPASTQPPSYEIYSYPHAKAPVSATSTYGTPAYGTPGLDREHAYSSPSRLFRHENYTHSLNLHSSAAAPLTRGYDSSAHESLRAAGKPREQYPMYTLERTPVSSGWQYSYARPRQSEQPDTLLRDSRSFEACHTGSQMSRDYRQSYHH
jgi:hypothetical protein